MKWIRRTYSYIAFSMSLVLFVTSVGFAVDMHYCRGQLKSVSFFGKAQSCHEKATTAATTCPHHQKASGKTEALNAQNCCSNRTQHFQSDQDLHVQTADLLLSHPIQQFVLAHAATFIGAELDAERVEVAFARYKPPLLLRDYAVLHQTFLF